MNKRDILFLLQFFYPEYISSATLPYDTARKLASEGYTVDVLCGYPSEYSDDKNIPYSETVEQVNIRRVRYVQMNRKKKLGRLVNYLSLTFSIFFHLFEMRKYKTIIVYSNPPILPLVAFLASKLFKCKLIFVAYDLYPEIALRTSSLSEGSIVTRLMRIINRLVYRQAAAVVALSSEMKEYIVQNRVISPEKVFVIPNWYKDEYQDSCDTADNIFSDLVKERFVIGYFGNMGVAQDMHPIIEAIRYFRNDPKVCFLLSGHGSKHSEIKAMIAEENIDNAFIFGFLQGKHYLDALKISNCAIVSLEKGLTGLCVPSKTYGYMMHGLPIVAIMDESDIVRDIYSGSGYHIPENSPNELISAINEMKNSPSECIIKGDASRQIYLRSYTPEVCLQKYVQLLKSILTDTSEQRA